MRVKVAVKRERAVRFPWDNGIAEYGEAASAESLGSTNSSFCWPARLTRQPRRHPASHINGWQAEGLSEMLGQASRHVGLV